MTECEITRNLLDRYIENELSEQERERIDAHISGCDACREALDRALSEKETLEKELNLLSEEPPQALFRAVMNDVRREKRIRRRRMVLRFLPAAACFVLVVTAILWFRPLFPSVPNGGEAPAPNDSVLYYNHGSVKEPGNADPENAGDSPTGQEEGRRETEVRGMIPCETNTSAADASEAETPTVDISDVLLRVMLSAYDEVTGTPAGEAPSYPAVYRRLIGWYLLTEKDEEPESGEVGTYDIDGVTFRLWLLEADEIEGYLDYTPLFDDGSYLAVLARA